MSAESILREFQRRQRLIKHLSVTEADARLTAFLNFLNSHSETKDIIQDVTSKFPVYDLIKGCSEGKPPHAGKLEEIVSVGLYLMDECSNGKHLYDVARKLGMYPSTKSRAAAKLQDYVDEAEDRYITPALDFIEDKLTEVTTGEQKSDKGKVTGEIKTGARAAAKVVKAKKNDVESLDKTPDELTVEEASIGTSNIPDQPTPYDALGFEPYTTAIAEFLSNEDTKPPLTLSIEGEWGSGKTSFMLQLGKKLKEKDGLVVTFSPWRHDKEDSLWAAFALEFTRQLSENLKWKDSLVTDFKLLWRRFNWREGWLEVAKVTAVWLAYISVFFSIVITLWVGRLPYIENWAVKMLLSGAGVLAVIYMVFRNLKKIVGNPLKYDLKKYAQAPDYITRISFIEQFHKDFKKIVETYAVNKKVYVFIDDLDRCEVPKAADLMQAINLMISGDPQLIFVIGMDRKKVAAGLVVKHEKLLPYLSSQQSNGLNGLDYGYSFIEKFIQLPFSVPRPTESDIENLMDEIAATVKQGKEEPLPEKQTDDAGRTIGGIQTAKKGSEEEQVAEPRREMLHLKPGDDSPEVRQIVLMAAPVWDYNPRRTKQFINLFRLRAYIASETGLFDILEGENQFNRLTLEQLGKFVAISMAWPSLIADFDQDPDLLKRLAIASEKDIKKESDYAQQWFKNEKLMNLIHYVPKDVKDFEDTKYSFLYVNVKKLLEISPVVSRREDIVKEDLTTTKKEYKVFYNELLDRLRKSNSGIRSRQQALPQSWLTLPSGYGDIHFEWAFHGRPRSWFEVGLHFDKSIMEENRKLYNHFLNIKKELKRKLKGLRLTFEFPWGAKSARIYTSKQTSEITEELKDWAVETMLEFYKVFKPRLDEFMKDNRKASQPSLG